MNIVIIILSALLGVMAVVDMFRSRPSALWMAWFALAGIRLADVNVPLWSTIIFCAAACGIVLAIGYMLPQQVSDSRVGIGYFGVGSIVGAAALYAVRAGQSSLIIGAVVGTLVAAALFSCTPEGRKVASPIRRYVNYVTAKGVYVVVTTVVVAMALINALLFAITL